MKSECPESINGLHTVGDVEIEANEDDDTTVLLITCLHCEAIGRLEFRNLDIDWTKEDEDEEDEEEEDDDPLRDAED